MEKLKSLWANAKDLFDNSRQEFCQLATKASFGLLYFINLFIPYYFGVVFATKIRVNVNGLKATWLYLIIFLVPIFLYLFFALEKKIEKANKVFKIHTILTIVMFFWFFIVFLADTSGISTSGVGLGFFIQIILVSGMALLTWKESLIMGYVYKIFKISKIEEVEYVKVHEENPEPVEVVKPEPVKEEAPKPVKEEVPEPVKEEVPEPFKEEVPVENKKE
jgi:hypothetical protein